MIQAAPSNSLANAPRDAGQEVPFDLRELIYSRTDERGVIQAANDVFGRLAGYSFDEFVGAPHKLIRHPDMPKGFFHIFWQYLKAGEPAVGYVKNRSKDGRYYWVLAAAIPCEGGFFSVRMKPSSNLFHTIRTEYANLRRREEKEELSAEASAEILLERLHELGFYSYPEFMSEALQLETAARDAGLSRPADKVAAHLTSLVTALTDALKEQTRLVGLFDSLKLLPVNMRLIAARLEPQGGPISQISMNYKTSFDNISERLTKSVTGEANLCKRMDVAVRRGLILTNCSRLHLEMCAHIRIPGAGHDGPERRKEHVTIEELGTASLKRVQTSLAEASDLAATLISASFEIRRLVLGLDTIRILGRVESRRDHVFEAACSATLDQIDSVQAEITQSLQQLSNLAVSIQTNLAMINSARTKAQNAEAIRAQAEAEAKASAERLASTRSTGFMSTEPEFGEDPLTELETRSIERDPGDRTPRFAAE